MPKEFDPVDKFITEIIITAARSLPEDSQIRMKMQDDGVWFFFGIHSERGGLIKGAFNPLAGIKATYMRLSNGANIVYMKNFVIPHMFYFVRELLMDMNQDIGDFVHAIINKAGMKSLHKEYRRAAREVRLAGKSSLLEGYTELGDYKQPMQELGEWLFNLQIRREKVTSGRKESRLFRWEYLEMGDDYKRTLKRCQDIKRYFKKVKVNHKPARRQLATDSLQSVWEATYLRTAHYHDIPLDIFSLFVHKSARDVAATIIARKYGVEPTTFLSHIQPEIAKLRKSLTSSRPNK